MSNIAVDHDLSEKALLGSLLLKGDTERVDYSIDTIQTPDYFFDKKHKKVWNSIRRIHKKQNPVNAITVAEDLESQGELADVGGSAYLSELIESTPDPSSYRQYIEIIEGYFMRRKVNESLDSYDPLDPESDPKEIIEDVMVDLEKIRDFGKGQSNIVQASDGFERLIEMAEQAEEHGWPEGYIESGFPKLDDAMNAFAPTDFALLRADTKMGKTTFGLQIADFVAEHECPVLIYSGEMQAEELALKWAGKNADIDMNDVLRGGMDDDDWNRLINVRHQMAEKDVYLLRDDNPDIRSFRDGVRKAMNEHDVGFVLLDYIQLFGNHLNDSNKRVEYLDDISTQLVTFTNRNRIPILGISRTNKEGETYGSSQFGFDANYTIFMEGEVEDNENVVRRIISVDGARLAPGGEFPLYFEKNKSRFYSPKDGDRNGTNNERRPH